MTAQPAARGELRARCWHIRDAYGRAQYTGTFECVYVQIARGTWIAVAVRRVAA